MLKLNNVAGGVKSRSSSTFGSVRIEPTDVKKKLYVLRVVPDMVGPTYEELKVEGRIIDLNYREELMWWQCSRIHWVVKGETNTTFFSRKASSVLRKKICVEKWAKPDGSLCEDQVKLGRSTAELYKKLFVS